MKIFIGSSTQQLECAEEIALWLEKDKIDAHVWNEIGIFVPGQYSLDDLVKQSKEVDAAIFIFAEDDKTWYHSDIVNAVRDNVLFEYGLFSGELSREKVIFMVKGEPKLATDLKGITYIKIDDNNKRDARQRLLDWVKRINPDGIRMPKQGVYVDNIVPFDEKGHADQIYTIRADGEGWVKATVDYSQIKDSEPAYSGLCIKCDPHLDLTTNKALSIGFEFLDSGIKTISLEVKNNKIPTMQSISLYPDMIVEGKCEIDITRWGQELRKNIDEIVYCTKPGHFTDSQNKIAVFRIGDITLI